MMCVAKLIGLRPIFEYLLRLKDTVNASGDDSRLVPITMLRLEYKQNCQENVRIAAH